MLGHNGKYGLSGGRCVGYGGRRCCGCGMGYDGSSCGGGGMLIYEFMNEWSGEWSLKPFISPYIT